MGGMTRMLSFAMAVSVAAANHCTPCIPVGGASCGPGLKACTFTISIPGSGPLEFTIPELECSKPCPTAEPTPCPPVLHTPEPTPCPPEVHTPTPTTPTPPTPTPLTPSPPRTDAPKRAQVSPPTRSPTGSPTKGCPVTMTVNVSGTPVEPCPCKTFTCDSPTSPWSTKDYRFCGQCPEFLNGASHFSCPACATAGTDVNFECPADWEVCDVFVSVYSNCATRGTDGGLAASLQAEGFSAGSCGPSFCLSFNDTCQNNVQTNAVTVPGDTNIKFNLVLFHKQFQGGEKIEIPTLQTDPTMYFTFFIKQGISCSNAQQTQQACTAEPGLCKWDDSRAQGEKCYAEICPPKPPGVRPCCDIAPGVEAKDCHAEAKAITSVCDFHLPQC